MEGYFTTALPVMLAPLIEASIKLLVWDIRNLSFLIISVDHLFFVIWETNFVADAIATLEHYTNNL